LNRLPDDFLAARAENGSTAAVRSCIHLIVRVVWGMGDAELGAGKRGLVRYSTSFAKITAAGDAHLLR
jgi:hypothetical protein